MTGPRSAPAAEDLEPDVAQRLRASAWPPIDRSMNSSPGWVVTRSISHCGRVGAPAQGACTLASRTPQVRKTTVRSITKFHAVPMPCDTAQASVTRHHASGSRARAAALTPRIRKNVVP